jgi:hypothetical protein
MKTGTNGERTKRSKRGSKHKRIRIPRFGSCIGLIFEKGGSAEILMTFPEISRLMRSWVDHEQQRRNPDEKTISALNVLLKKVRKFDAALVAEVPIAQRRAKIVPIFNE